MNLSIEKRRLAERTFQRLTTLAFPLLLSFATSLYADTFFVAVEGKNVEDRDGRSQQTAWQSLAYACERVPAGNHTIQIGSGGFVAERTARPKSGLTIAGAGHTGEGATRIIASPDWPLVAEINPEGGKDLPDEYLVFLDRVENVAIRDLALGSPPDHRVTGALLCRGGKQITLQRLFVHEFRWAGLTLEHSSNLDVSYCTIENASTEKHRWHNGLIRSRWITDSEIHHNRIVSTEGGGYGYKAGGHRNVRIHHNHIDVAGGLAIESAHENEYDVEIDHNYATRCISIPKGGQGADPTKEGCEYSFWIHHNILTDSYTIEGPRNHLRLSYNYIRIEKPNGRVYTHHGGTNHGPIWIHNNVVENMDRALVWMNNGLAENIYVYNNTVYCADAGDRAGAVFDAYTAERLNNWVVKNNIIVVPASQPRRIFPQQRGVPDKINAIGNVCINLTGVPTGNHEGVDPGLRRDGEKPWPYYAPAGPDSFVVDRGLDVGLPFEGDAPDIGAYELGEKRPLGKIGP